jgi:hypothetical protein
MRGRPVRIRKPFFVAVEGESEQSFFKWVQTLADDESLHVHLDVVVLGGGGLQKMLKEATRQRVRRAAAKRYVASYLVVDSDRSGQGDCSIHELRIHSAKQKLELVCQLPNHEGLLVRLFPGREKETLDATSASARLHKLWPTYQKPVNAYTLARQFKVKDLIRVAKLDEDLRNFLMKIGFKL